MGLEIATATVLMAIALAFTVLTHFIFEGIQYLITRYRSKDYLVEAVHT